MSARQYHLRLVLASLVIAVSFLNLGLWRARVNATATAGEPAIGQAVTAVRATPEVPGNAPAVPTVRVLIEECDGRAYGSGTILSGGRILTARHVVEQAQALVVETEDGVRYPVADWVVDPDGRDAALLRVPGLAARTPRDVATVTPAEPERGSAVAIVGHPQGGQLYITYTVVSNYTAREPLTHGGLRIMIVDEGFAEGMSGGPAVDEAGHVVGVAVAIEQTTNTGLVVPASGLAALLSGRGDVLEPAC